MNEARPVCAPATYRRADTEDRDRRNVQRDVSTSFNRTNAPRDSEASDHIGASRVGVLQQDATGQLLVTLDGRLRAVRRATSCLIQPMPGDRVQLISQGDTTWVTAVLDRAKGQPVELNFDRERVTLRAESLEVACATSMALSAHRIDSRSVVATQACTDRYANVSGMDSIKAQSTIVHTEGHMSLHAGNTSLTADTLIKVDAGQVHMC